MRSNHAETRAKQRGVPPLVVQWLSDFGQEQYDGYGGVIRFFNRRSIRALERNVGRAPVARMSEFLNCYSVESVDGGGTITIGRRFKRIRRR